jgi:NAD(P)-dependent dehydrogenase (short-subunit alcohol dehydrogenase family)
MNTTAALRSLPAAVASWRAIARRLHDEGAIVHVLDLKPAHASEWSFHTVDVANEAAVDTTFDAIGKTAGNIDYLVCCAGIYRPRPFLSFRMKIGSAHCKSI